MMMSFAQSLIGIGTMLYPVMVQMLMDRFGFRGCLAILAAVSSHSIFGMLIMHPVEWHMKIVELNETELKEIPTECKMVNSMQENQNVMSSADDTNESSPLNTELNCSETSETTKINLTNNKSEDAVKLTRRLSIAITPALESNVTLPILVKRPGIL